MPLEDSALPYASARAPIFQSGLKALRKQPSWRLRSRSRIRLHKWAPNPFLIDKSFFPVPSGVARAISRCPEEVKMSSILLCFVRFPMSGAHGCSSAPTRVPLRDAWTTHERSWSPMSATPWHFRAALSATHCRFRAPTGVTHGRARAPMSVSHGHYQRQWVACIGARKFH